ncbi:MAG: fumarylacetoacetate hydrolase family protein [Balneolaceae bacterium]|nr:fumarylacetoacetate hydrolase family protein [Balneolaceae bacterium]
MFELPGLPHLSAGTLFCIGRNYIDHAKELDNPVPSQPLVFLKSRNTLVYPSPDAEILLPSESSDVHHEVELVLAIGEPLHHATEEEAFEAIAGVAVGIDCTARDLQSKAKEKGHPWTLAKGFHTFSPIGEFVPFDQLGAHHVTDLSSLTISCSVNGEQRQIGSVSDMIFSPVTLIQYVSTICPLVPGDVLFTGTPAGVARLQAGDTLQATLHETSSALSLDVVHAPMGE